MSDQAMDQLFTLVVNPDEIAGTDPTFMIWQDREDSNHHAIFMSADLHGNAGVEQQEKRNQLASALEAVVDGLRRGGDMFDEPDADEEPT